MATKQGEFQHHISQGIADECGLEFSIFTSIGNDGVSSAYCATATAYTSGAIETAIETGTPGDPNNEQWAEISCSYGSLTSIFNNPYEQWNDSGASAAFADVKAKWEMEGRAKASFPDYVADFFHTRPDISCEVLDKANCKGEVSLWH